MVARYAYRAFLLALLFCSVWTVAVALENGKGSDTLVVQVSITLCATRTGEQTCLLVS
jgi:zinc transporter 7